MASTMTARLHDADGEALDRLLEVARRDTGQSRRVADFLLSWWNADTCGGWNPVDMWGLDTEICLDILRLVIYLARPGACYPDTLGYKAEFDRLVRDWRPHLVDKPLHGSP